MKRKRDCFFIDMFCLGLFEEEKDCNIQICVVFIILVFVIVIWNLVCMDVFVFCQYFVGYFCFKNISIIYCNL